MRPTQFFRSKAELTNAAKQHSKAHQHNWVIRTKLPCNHRVNHNNKAIVLLENETIVQRLVLCNCCNQFYNQNVGNHE